MGQSVKKSVNTESLMFKVNNEYELQDTTGNRNTSYIQEGFGNVVAQSGSADNNYHLTTKEIDSDTGLYYFYARWYDSGVGRFVSQDPIWHVNLYSYVGNNPVNFVDPLGLARTDRWDPRFYTDFWGNFFGGAYDFWRNYQNMRDAKTIGADKYFHCMANCQSSRRGFGGREAAEFISEGREFFDGLKGDSRLECDADREANRHGREGNPNDPCETVCEPIRPRGLNPKY